MKIVKSGRVWHVWERDLKPAPKEDPKYHTYPTDFCAKGYAHAARLLEGSCWACEKAGTTALVNVPKPERPRALAKCGERFIVKNTDDVDEDRFVARSAWNWPGGRVPTCENCVSLVRDGDD